MRTIHRLTCLIFHRADWHTQRTNEWGPCGEMFHVHRACRRCGRQWGRFRPAGVAPA
ncbi:hypothetical protein [Limnoglobus roseus]|uniref:hypothetical protein n=1 Tax=Limnoglobus roseus TaxID=2598579 RepID=UPI00143DF84C|nr:hypothetical protein [Limnoglobus roseus]